MRKVGIPYRKWTGAEAFDAIVIGSGVGGLGIAALLAQHAALKVLVLEQHTVAGGFTHTFRRPGYEWDIGVHYVGEVNQPGTVAHALFHQVSEGRLRWHPMPEVYDRIIIAGRSYDFPAGKERLRDALKGYFPGEAAAIDNYLRLVGLSHRSSALFFGEKGLPPPLARTLGPELRAQFLRYASLTTRQVLRAVTQNAELAGVLAGQWGNYGLPPGRSSFGVHASVSAHYLDGASFPVGGSSEIAHSIAPSIERAGGCVVTGAEVARILLDGQGRACGVALADGREIRAPIVISNAGAHNTYGRLLPPAHPATRSLREALDRVPPSVSYVCLYAGIRREPGEPEFSATNLWIYPGPDHDANAERQKAAPETADFSVTYVSFPSAKDPTFAERFPGRSTIEVVAPAFYEDFSPWAATRWRQRGADYEALKARLGARLKARLEESVPAVRGRIERWEVSTPLSVAHFAAARRGETYGLDASPSRFGVADLGVRTPVEGLYLVGQDAAMLGVVGSMLSAVAGASLILKQDLMSRLAPPGANGR